MKPNMFDRFVLRMRKHVFVPAYDYLLSVADTDTFIFGILLFGISVPFIYLLGMPFMLWIRVRGMTMFLEDDDHWRRYPCRRIYGESGVNWRKEGF